METLEQIRDRLAAALPGAVLEIVVNPGPAAEHSLLVDNAHARAAAQWLRDDDALALDYCSNVTGIDWLERGHFEVVYHLFSMRRKHGPVILRLRTGDRAADVRVPSLTPVWRSCELQEREVYDLFGVVFDDHPDLRRLLMWDEFRDHPMRKDYVEPDDYEWEPTPHGAVLEKAKRHWPAPPPAAPAASPQAPA
jgi:NADH-quinone oxidoreductase subunit C